jgi:hypothetical protein
MSHRASVAEYTIFHYDEVWIVSSGSRLLASFPSRLAAEQMVRFEVDARCEAGEVSRITIEDGLDRQVQYCRFPNTPMH